MAPEQVGRSDAYASSYDLESEMYVPLLKGDVHKPKEVLRDMMLSNLDVVNTQPQGGQDIMSTMGSLVKSTQTEVMERLRWEVDWVVKGYVDQGVAEVIPGMVFIDEVRSAVACMHASERRSDLMGFRSGNKVHMLDIECFTYLNALLESPMAPTVILATNQGNSLVRGTPDIVAARRT